MHTPGRLCAISELSCLRSLKASRDMPGQCAGPRSVLSSVASTWSERADFCASTGTGTHAAQSCSLPLRRLLQMFFLLQTSMAESKEWSRLHPTAGLRLPPASLRARAQKASSAIRPQKCEGPSSKKLGFACFLHAALRASVCCVFLIRKEGGVHFTRQAPPF